MLFRSSPPPMLIESQVKFHSPQNISGASRQNNIAAFSLTTEVDGDLFQEVKKTTGKKSQNIKWLHRDPKNDLML